MSEVERGKRIVEEIMFEQFPDANPLITGFKLTESWDGDFPHIEGSTDFVVRIHDRVHGIELAKLHGIGNAWVCYEEAALLGRSTIAMRAGACSAIRHRLSCPRTNLRSSKSDIG